MAVASFDELLNGCKTQAVHLEMRDYYSPEDPIYLDWLAGRDVVSIHGLVA